MKNADFFPKTPRNDLLSQAERLYRILVVDGDGESCHRTAYILFQAGYAVSAAANGSFAWDSLQLNRYDLMIIDHEVAKTTGLELPQKIHAARMGLPIIMVAESLTTAQFAESPWLEPEMVLLKPFHPDDLLENVNIILTQGFQEKAGSRLNWQNHVHRFSLQQ